MITKHLKDCINHLPKGRWFTWQELPIFISRREWVCGRLHAEGVLNWKVEFLVKSDTPSSIRTDFRTVAYYELVEK